VFVPTALHAPAKVGSAATGSSVTSTSSYATSLPSGSNTTKNNKLILVVGTHSANSAPTLAVSGWTQAQTGNISNLVTVGTAWLFWKDAAGSDAAPTLSFSGTNPSGVAWMIEEFAGLALGSPDVIGTVKQWSGVSGSQTLSATATTGSTDFMYSCVAGTDGGAVPTTTWGGGTTQDLALVQDANKNAFLTTAFAAMTTAGAAFNPTASNASNFLCANGFTIGFTLAPQPVVQPILVPALVRAGVI
jgi:hypothetical protein